MSTHPILLVEDDQNDVFFFQRAMRKAGMSHSLQLARDGQEAIDYMEARGKFAAREKFPVPCLILLDLKLPMVMGLDVLRWIRQHLGLAPIVVILTSSLDQADIAEAYDVGANAYLVKPAEASQLVETVKAINDFWVKYNIPPPVDRLDSEPAEAQKRARGLAQFHPLTRM